MYWQTIGEKEVSIVDEHHHAMAAWAEIRTRIEYAPTLITFDSHPDLHIAFMRHLRLAFDSPKLPGASAPLVGDIKFDDPQKVDGAIQRLANDEHIDCARRAGIIGDVFVSLGVESGNVRLPGVVVFDDGCVPWCRKKIHDDDCFRRHADHVIEGRLIRPRVKKILKRVGRRFDTFPYILDIDLDVFRTRKSAAPEDEETFHDLIRHATAITIAREPGCVESLRLDGETITATDLEGALLDHIERACARDTRS